jgi:hypothetical protein
MENTPTNLVATEPVAAERERNPTDEFTKFARSSVGFVAAVVAAFPMLTDYFGVLVGSPQNDKSLATIATLVSGGLFLSLFWTRQKLQSTWSVVVGVAAMLLGAAFLVVMHSDKSLMPSSQITLYMVGFPLLLGGAALMFIYGFVIHEERTKTLNVLAPRLMPEDWNRLLQIAEAQVTRRNETARLKIPDRSKNALRRSESHILEQYANTLDKLAKGTLEIRGPIMDDIFQYFVAGVEQRFRAISLDDLEYWCSPECERYFSINEGLVRDGREVERIFVFPRDRSLTNDELDALARQVDVGIGVCIVYEEDAEEVVDNVRNLDFGLFDTFAVSYWRQAQGRVCRIETAPKECEEHRKLYERVRERCQWVPGKRHPVFTSRHDIEAWNHARVSRAG